MVQLRAMQEEARDLTQDVKSVEQNLIRDERELEQLRVHLSRTSPRDPQYVCRTISSIVCYEINAYSSHLGLFSFLDVCS